VQPQKSVSGLQRISGIGRIVAKSMMVQKIRDVLEERGVGLFIFQLNQV